MSLDVHIKGRETELDFCPCCGASSEVQKTLYTANITHNLGKMAKEAGIYMALWRPEEIGAEYSKDIIEVVELGLRDLKDKPEYFKQFNSPNGWGMYEHFVPFVEKYLEALKEYPEGLLYSCR